ncbi:MAG: 23S rRNA (pseudouridine(1915)-N(3))-methyltransferase RlmH [Mycoplasmataceae bacterium]|nr:23S rRNA (pseudouridine(1915)-N(3))-methyltransferase RlmH [Mycoplasmataceae bacterium]
MKINIIALGKLSKDYQVLFNDYNKRITPFAKMNIIELKEVKDNNIEVQKKKETDLILKSIPKNSKVIYCSIDAKQKTSVEFSEMLREDNITFVIGGSHGVDESVFKNKINFSKMTFPHQLFRVMLIEQIYRGFAIQQNSKYHK